MSPKKTHHNLPALLGGSPIRPSGPPAWPFPDMDVIDAIQSTHADSSWGQYHGPHVERLESALAAFHQTPFVLTCASGTLAVETALRSLKVGAGDEVIQAAYDYEPNFLTIHAVGATPVLVDLAANNANLDPDMLEDAITTQTRAILVSHLHGGVIPMSRVMEIAQRHGLPVVEDAAQATGALIEGRRAGSWGQIGVLSFGGSKLLSSGRGGALLIHRPEILQRARLFLSRGIQQWAALSELQGAVLLPQLAKLSERNDTRLRRVNDLATLIAEIPGIRLLENRVPCEPAFYKVGFRYDAKAFGLSRDLFVKAMRAEGIAFDAGFRALHSGRSASRFRIGAPFRGRSWRSGDRSFASSGAIIG